MRSAISLLAILFLPLALAVAALAQHGPENITIDAAKNKKAAVEFPHFLHQEKVESCKTCHHTLADDFSPEAGVTEVKPCSSCHLDPEKDTTPSMREMSLKKNPLHIGCIDCHKAESKGPTKCNDCHPKE